MGVILVEWTKMINFKTTSFQSENLNEKKKNRRRDETHVS